MEEDHALCTALACTPFRDALFVRFPRFPEDTTCGCGMCTMPWAGKRFRTRHRAVVTSVVHIEWVDSLPDLCPEWLQQREAKVCTLAAGEGNLEVLEWAWGKGCNPLTRATYMAAAENEHRDVLRWLRASPRNGSFRIIKVVGPGSRDGETQHMEMFCEKSTRMREVMGTYCGDQDMDAIDWQFEGEKVQPNRILEDVEDLAVIHARVDRITVEVKWGPAPDERMEFSMLKSQRLWRLMSACQEKRGQQDLDGVEFFLDGVMLWSHRSAASVGMKDGDSIDVREVEDDGEDGFGQWDMMMFLPMNHMDIAPADDVDLDDLFGVPPPQFVLPPPEPVPDVIEEILVPFDLL